MKVKKLVEKMKGWFLDQSFMKSISILAAGTTISHLFILLTTPVLTRLYSPEEFGIFSIYLSILYTVSVIASLMYDQAVPLPKSDQEGWDTLVLSLIIALLMSALTYAAANLLPIGDWTGNQQLGRYAWLLSLSVFGVGWFQAFNSWSIRVEDYPAISKSKIYMNTGQMVSQIAFGVFQTGAVGLLAGEVLGRLTGCATYIRQILKKKPHVVWFNFIGMRNACVRYKNFPLISSWSALINVSGTHLPPVFLAVHYGPSVAGWYLLAEKILTVPEAVIGYSAKQVYMAQAAKKSGNGEEFKALFWMTVRKMTILGGGIIGGIVLVVPLLIPVLFGEGWRESGSFLYWISILYFMRMVVNPVAGNFYALETQFFQFVSEGIRFLLIVSSLFLTFYFVSDPALAILCISLLTSLGYLTNGFFSWYVMNARFRRKADS
jgi:O-antigen/teichoic acid export membrane protein